jgi:hypothetical protein
LLLARDQIHRSVFSATINLDFKFEPVAFVKAGHAGAFNRRDMDKSIRLAVVTLNKAEAFHCIEEFDCSCAFFARQCALRCAATAAKTTAAFAWRIAIARGRTVSDRHGFAVNLQVSCRNFATAIDEREAERLTFGQARQTSLFDSRNMHEHIFATIIADDKTKAFLTVEKFDDPGAFADDLRRHTAARTTATTAKTTTAAAAETAATAAETITAATAETITAAAAAKPIAAKTAAISAAAAAATFIAETIALIASASAAITAATFIETHAVPVLSSKSPACYIQETSCAGRGQNVSRRNIIMRHASRDSRKPPMLRAKIVRQFIAGKS